MDFLFDNPLANLYGPYFLVFYIVFIAAVAIGFRAMRSSLDVTTNFSVPPIPNNPNAFEIAYLRGGENELARTVVFSLAQRNLLKFISDEKNPQIYPTVSEFDKRNLSTIERTAYEWFDQTRDVKELFKADGLANALKPYAETYRARLEMQHFLPDEAMKARNNRLTRMAILLFAGLGAYKFIAAIYNGHWNVAGLVIITLVGLWILSSAMKTPRLTNLGKEYLKRLQLAFERIKPSNHFSNETITTTPSATFAAVDPFLVSVGVFGGAALAGTIYSDYNRAFERAHTQSVGASCGSGCGSASSCSSGGGDGGGSSCGGGCGGCGG